MKRKGDDSRRKEKEGKGQESGNHGAQKTNEGRRRGGRKKHARAKMWNEYMTGNQRTREEATGNEEEDAGKKENGVGSEKSKGDEKITEPEGEKVEQD